MLKINKKTQIKKLIIFIIAFFIVFIPSLAMNIWARKAYPDGSGLPIGNQDL
jgi:hypothetical protein